MPAIIRRKSEKRHRRSSGWEEESWCGKSMSIFMCMVCFFHSIIHFANHILSIHISLDCFGYRDYSFTVYSFAIFKFVLPIHWLIVSTLAYGNPSSSQVTDRYWAKHICTTEQHKENEQNVENFGNNCAPLFALATASRNTGVLIPYCHCDIVCYLYFSTFICGRLPFTFFACK